jgi:SAM-dependent methyltransferase
MSAGPSIYESGEYAARNPEWHLEHSPWKARQIRNMLEKHRLQPGRIVEVGCGAGAILEALRGELAPRPTCLGYEISPQAYALAKQREGEGLQFRLGSPAPEHEPFDLALAIDVLEHVEDYLGFIRSLQTLARWKILHIPLDLSVLSLCRPMYLRMAREHVGHLHYFTLETALASVEQAGLKVKDWFFTSVELDQGAAGQKRLHLLRRWLHKWRPELAARWLGGFSVLVLCE